MSRPIAPSGWNGDRCPDCGREWPTEAFRAQCLTEHGPSAVGRPAPEPVPAGQVRVTGL